MDGRGVVRGRTKLGQLVVWLIPADPLKSVIEEELGRGLAHPGLYVLMDEQTDRVYIGESSNLRARLGQHLDHAPKELGRFDRALIINDGRAAVHSRFNDSTLREALEQAAIKLFLDGEAHSAVNQQKKMPELSVTQQTLFEELRSELGHVLYELELIDSRPRAGRRFDNRPAPRRGEPVSHARHIGDQGIRGKARWSACLLPEGQREVTRAASHNTRGGTLWQGCSRRTRTPMLQPWPLLSDPEFGGQDLARFQTTEPDSRHLPPS